MILVTGATGKTGQAMLSALAARGLPARGLVRSTEQAAKVEHAGGEAAIGDLLDSASLAAALRGVQAVYLICPNVHPEELRMVQNTIAAAQQSGRPRVVYHSVLFPQIEAMPHHWLKLRTEEALITSGLPFAILQPASYMQNVLGYVEVMRSSGVYSAPYSPDAIFTPIDLHDLAEVAAMVLTNPDHDGGIYPLAGPQGLSSADMARAIGEQLGTHVEAKNQPLGEWVKAAKTTDMAPYAIDTLARMFAYYDVHGFWASCTVLRALLGRAPTDFATFLARELK